MVDEGARLRTLLPLVRNVIMVVLLLMVVMIVLSSLGVDIGPLLAGAGVVGLAIGFGAQALVRDIVSGIFFLVDDAFRVGEYIEIGNLRGTVEAISIRSLRLRHHRGAIHTLPFGEIRSMTNYSRDWIIMKLEFRVPFSTDLNLVKKIVKKVGAELSAHPEYAPHILETVKSQGVRRMEEFNMVVGVKFMTKPGEQWVIRREVYQRILLAFEAAGIRLASRNVVVEVTGERPSIEDIDRIAAAAIDATERPPSLKAATA
ncbi:MAG: mechanosensitive ion channel [Azospirillum sp.]|nr:mechanosensitive ion channel [Azospirillum sp.]